MRTSVKLAAYGGALVLAFTGALGVGSVVGGPVATIEENHGAEHGATSAAGATDHEAMTEAADEPGGLMVSDRGYSLELTEDTFPASADVPLAYRIVGADGEPIVAYKKSHDENMHLIAVRRDTTGFQHVHPTLDGEGT